MTSPHQVSSSVSRNGCPPIPAVFGTGTSMVRTAAFSTVLGYRRCTRTCRESGSSTGANLMWLPAAVMSVSPARRATVRSRATSSKLRTGSGSSPYRSDSSSCTAAASASESMAAIRV